MASLNKVFLMGNLTKAPELRYTPSGAAVCDFSMAINRTYTSNNEKKEEVCFIDVNVWGKQAETCNRYLQKGSPLLVEGRLQFDTWQDKETNQQRSKIKVVAERTQFLGSPGRKEFGDNAPGGGYQADTQQNYSQPPQQAYTQAAPAQPPQNSYAPPQQTAYQTPQEPRQQQPMQQAIPPQQPANNTINESVPPAMPSPMPENSGGPFDPVASEDDIPF